jgi:biotin transport system substrate-specific component
VNGHRNLAPPVLACLFAALTSLGAYIAIPIPGTPVPVVLQNLFILLGALLLGPGWGLVATSLYLAMGVLGLPVFAGGTGGLARFLGPTGGFLLGYLPATWLVGFISATGPRRGWRDAMAVIAGTAVVYGCGVPWLKMAIHGSWAKALAGGFLPFIPGDLIKMVLAVLIAGRLAPLAERAIPRGGPAKRPEEDAPTHG